MPALLSYRTRPRTDTIVLHATGTEPGIPANRLAATMAVQGRAMGLLEVGYHAIIMEDGRLIECRPHTVMGVHANHHNDHTLGVALAGGVRNGQPADTFTPAQWDALALLWWMYERHYGPLTLTTHSSINRRRSRMCPPLEKELAELCPRPLPSPSLRAGLPRTAPS